MKKHLITQKSLFQKHRQDNRNSSSRKFTNTTYNNENKLNTIRRGNRYVVLLRLVPSAIDGTYAQICRWSDSEFAQEILEYVAKSGLETGLYRLESDEPTTDIIFRQYSSREKDMPICIMANCKKALLLIERFCNKYRYGF